MLLNQADTAGSLILEVRCAWALPYTSILPVLGLHPNTAIKTSTTAHIVIERKYCTPYCCSHRTS